MSGTKAGAEKQRASMIAKHGSEEAWKQWMSEQGHKGGTTKKLSPSGFAYLKEHDPERLHEISSRGGINGGRRA